MGKCDYELPDFFLKCNEEATKLFFDNDSGLEMWCCNEHFDILRADVQKQRDAIGLPEQTPPVDFDLKMFNAIRGRID